MKVFTGDEEITPVVQQLIVPSQLEHDSGKGFKNEYPGYLLFLLISVGLLVFGYYTQSDATLLFGGVMLLFLILGFIQSLIKRRVALIMRSKASLTGPTIVITEDPPAKATNIPLFQLAVYEQNELPDHGYTLNTHLTEEKNIFHKRWLMDL